MLLEVLEQPLLHSVRIALAEDIGSGDITAALVPADACSQARVISRESAVLCGTAWFNTVFAELDSRVQVNWQLQDGDSMSAGQTLCSLTGPSRALLSGERTALNFLQTLSATATLSRRYAEAVGDLPATVLDTRKTLPGLRDAQKYAVRIGGCSNHRKGLYDAYLIKENHIAAVGSIARAVEIARTQHPHLPVEVEVENLDELQQALATDVDRVLLDNFSIRELQEAVETVAGRVELEASGNVTLERIHDIAATGVDFISTGSLTKDIAAIDLSMIID